MTFALTTPPARPEPRTVTPSSATVTEYWLTQTGLNPITGREGPAQTEPVNIVKTVYAAGIDPDKAVPKSYLPGMVIGLTVTKLNRMIAADLIPSYTQGQSIMITPSDVAAAMIIAGYAYEAEDPESAEAAEPEIEEGAACL